MVYEAFLRFLGLGARAGKLAYGSAATDSAIKTGKARLVVVDGSASDSTKKSFVDACSYYGTRIIVLPEGENLAKYIGKGNKVTGIICPEFAENAIKKYDMCTGGEVIE
ncbi:MAG: L7Ae/L30e/S12e/Gadd45 family ribosomal protein [Christensenellaceae bacterium]|jgi:ribosomal protein L7Ae-like RNA K-turn-binding protein